VPNRNGVFIAIAAAHAEAAGLRRVVVGFNREEGATFPDNTPEFVARTNAALALSTLSTVEVVNPVGALDKVEIVRRGREAGAPLGLVWSCYHGEPEPCGACESCRRLFRALDAAGAREHYHLDRAKSRNSTAEASRG
jgi:7-cyano-7-deazaguanine synthase